MCYENNICSVNTNNIVIAPKHINMDQKVSKLKILPTPIKPALNTNISSKVNNTINNNCKYYIYINNI